MIGKCCKGKDLKRSGRDSIKALSTFTRKSRRGNEQSGLPDQYVHACVRMWYICICAFKFALKWQS